LWEASLVLKNSRVQEAYELGGAWIAVALMPEERRESLMQTGSKASFRTIASEIYREMTTLFCGE